MGRLKRRPFTREEEYKMVKMIEDNPVLYDLSHDLAKDTVYKNKIWEEIAYEVRKLVAVCKKRWKVIRHSYISGYRRRLSLDPSSATSCFNWHFWPKLQFLNVCLDPSKHNLSEEALIEDQTSDAAQNISSEECYEEESIDVKQEIERVSLLKADLIPETEPTTTTIEPPQPKIAAKRKQMRKTIKEACHSDGENNHAKDDTVDVFFKSMAMSVRKLPAHLIIKARMDICNLVSQYELEAMNLPRASTIARRKTSTAPKARGNMQFLLRPAHMTVNTEH